MINEGCRVGGVSRSRHVTCCMLHVGCVRDGDRQAGHLACCMLNVGCVRDGDRQAGYPVCCVLVVGGVLDEARVIRDEASGMNEAAGDGEEERERSEVQCGGWECRAWRSLTL